jgi:hypothetical protein
VMSMEAVRTSETSVNFNEHAERNIREDSRVRSLRCENLEAHLFGINNIKLERL